MLVAGRIETTTPYSNSFYESLYAYLWSRYDGGKCIRRLLDHRGIYEFKIFRIYSAVRLPDVPSVKVISSATNFRLSSASTVGFAR